MSSQFSYELDERQIRILMQDAESEYNEALWHKFDEMAACESKSSIDISSYVPKFNLSISRSIIVPILFIFLIGGLSAMLFSFVDFKKKNAIEKEIPLVANPENFKKTIAKPIIKAEPIKTKTTPVVTNSVAVITPSVEVVKTPSIIPVVETKKEESVKVTEQKPKEQIITTPDLKKNTNTQPEKKKKKKKMKVEELHTIIPSTNLNEGEKEPELDLR